MEELVSPGFFIRRHYPIISQRFEPRIVKGRLTSFCVIETQEVAWTMDSWYPWMGDLSPNALGLI
jgi:hypothetical protein